MPDPTLAATMQPSPHDPDRRPKRRLHRPLMFIACLALGVAVAVGLDFCVASLMARYGWNTWDVERMRAASFTLQHPCLRDCGLLRSTLHASSSVASTPSGEPSRRKAPMTSWPCRFNSAVATELSTPPDIATTMRACAAARSRPKLMGIARLYPNFTPAR